MSLNQKALFFVILFSLFLTTGMIIASLLNSNFGTVDVESVSISHAEIQLSGLLYKPKRISTLTSHPAVVLTHGLASSKESMSGIALELSRRGIIAMTVDEIGHGNSGGTFGFTSDPTLGILSAVRYIESLSYVNRSSIGLVGHSLGAGTVRATSVVHGNITAMVLIGGGLGEMVESPAYGVLNATFPKNLLIAIGKQDILFDIPSLREDLAPVFNTSGVVEPNIQYGSFSTNTARKLVLTTTIHLAEAFDPLIVSEIVQWMSLTLDPPTQVHLSSSDLLFLLRDIVIIGSFVLFIGFLCSFSTLLYHLLNILEKKEEKGYDRTFHENLKFLLVWSCVGAILFLPMMVIGVFIPPLLVGNSIIWWLFIWGVLGLLLLKFFLPKFMDIVPDIREKVINSSNSQEILIVAVLIVIIYFTSISFKTVLSINFQVLIPLFGDLLPISRLIIFFIFIPFLFIHFFADGLFFYEYYNYREREDVKSSISQFFKIVGIKIAPFVLIIVIIYGPMFLFDQKVVSGFLGLIFEFLVGMIPLILVSSFFTHWFYRLTGSIGTGAFYNALTIAWIIADTFTMGGFL